MTRTHSEGEVHGVHGRADGIAPRDHISKVLAATSMAPAPVPMRQKAAVSSRSDESKGDDGDHHRRA